MHTTVSESCGASASWKAPNPAAPPRTRSSRARPTVATTSAPHSAPAPKTEAIRPNTSTPSSRVRLASSGNSTSKLNENVLTSSTARNAIVTRRDPNANRNVSTTPARTGVAAPALVGRGSMRIATIAPITTT